VIFLLGELVAVRINDILMTNDDLGEGGEQNVSRNLTLVIHALHGGGAERVAATMANQWTAQGDRVTLITLDTVASDVYRVDAQVERVGLGLMRISANALHAGWNNAQRIRALRQAIRAAVSDCVVSITDRMNVLVLLATRGFDTPVVIAEHSDPRRQPMVGTWERLRKWTYPRCAAAVALTDTVAQYLHTVVGQRPVYVIPNGIRVPSVTASDIAERDKRTIVAMGRLSPEKGFDLLIDAFARLAAQHPDWRLEIAGEGPERAQLQQRIDQRGLRQQVQLVGWVDDPAQFLSRGAMFVMSSRYEGFPMSLLEAMACGVPVVSFDCDSGPRAIIRPEVDGLLVPAADPIAMAHAIDRLMSDPVTRHRLGQCAREVVRRFSLEVFAQRWNDVVNACLI
jgi:GalNAc-alpha-(1->4)-GalNAc-alpha-(1->3)-diNAcBac-PP-undecaprenol alpha-1,4-N-acetyl-D-galactosaminyltransferase